MWLFARKREKQGEGRGNGIRVTERAKETYDRGLVVYNGTCSNEWVKLIYISNKSQEGKAGWKNRPCPRQKKKKKKKKKDNITKARLEENRNRKY